MPENICKFFALRDYLIDAFKSAGHPIVERKPTKVRNSMDICFCVDLCFQNLAIYLLMQICKKTQLCVMKSPIMAKLV